MIVFDIIWQQQKFGEGKKKSLHIYSLLLWRSFSGNGGSPQWDECSEKHVFLYLSPSPPYKVDRSKMAVRSDKQKGGVAYLVHLDVCGVYTWPRHKRGGGIAGTGQSGDSMLRACVACPLCGEDGPYANTVIAPAVNQSITPTFSKRPIKPPQANVQSQSTLTSWLGIWKAKRGHNPQNERIS